MFGPTSTGVHRQRARASLRATVTTTTSCSPRRCCARSSLSRLTRGRLGRLLKALSDSPLALDTQGTTTNVTRVLVFCISAFLAGIFGALYAGFVGSINGSSFPSFTSLTILALVVLVIGGAPWYAVMAAAALELVPAYVTSADINTYLQILFGFAVIGGGAPSATPRISAHPDPAVLRSTRWTEARPGRPPHGRRDRSDGRRSAVRSCHAWAACRRAV